MNEMSAYVIPGVQVDVTVLKQVVAKLYGISPDEITKPTRNMTICRPRQILMAIMYGYYRIKGNDVVRSVGLRNHVTAIHSYRTVGNDYFTNRPFRESLNQALQSINIRPEEFSAAMKTRPEEGKKFELTHCNHE